MVVLEEDGRGYHHGVAGESGVGSLYLYRLDGQKERPDPASRFQPQGVHGPSQVVDPAFPWEERHWFGLPLEDYVIYELHVGAFTSEGTFDAVIRRLDDLKDLGITALELMPVAQFPGNRNWGYDGVDLFAVQNSYGGPQGLKRLVNACHARGLAVVLDVVYNHLGPEGNYLGDFAPYFTDRYKTPWGPALNFDGPDSDEVRRFFIENALYWYADFHVDALRLDAVHAILDHSPRPFLEELATEVHAQAKRLNRQNYLIPESAANDARLVRSPDLGGYGLDAQWNDDFHHSLRVLMTGEKAGYYQDYDGLRHLAKAYREGFVYCGEYSPFRRRRHGSSSRNIPAKRFVVFCQNHDQVGNRMLGERLRQLISFEELKLAAGVVLLSPFIPLLFMGEEYGEPAPFQYFISHSDPDLIAAVRKGRQEEFASFHWQGEPPDPQDEATFNRCRLNQDLRGEGDHAVLRGYYQELLRLRRDIPPLRRLCKETMDVEADEKNMTLCCLRWDGKNQVFAAFNFNDAENTVAIPGGKGTWTRRLDSTEPRWRSPGKSTGSSLLGTGSATVTLPPKAVVLYELRG